MKKLLILIIFSALFVLTSCDVKQLEEVIPDETSYANWDGNYLYYNNYRSKTDGTAEEQIITTFIHEDISYEVINCLDYCFHNNDIYYTFDVMDSNEIHHMGFLKYDIKNKEVEVIELTDNYIESYYLGTIALYKDEYIVSLGGNDYFKYNIITQEIKYYFSEANQNFILRTNRYYIYEEESIIYVDNWDTGEIIRVGEYQKEAFYSFIEIDDHPLLLIRPYGYLTDKNETLIEGLKAFDIKTLRMYELLDITEEKEIVSMKDNYFIIGERKYYGHKEAGYVEENLGIKNELYEITFNDNELVWRKINKFNSRKQYTILDIKDGVIKLKEMTCYYSLLTFYPSFTSKIKYYDIEEDKLSKNTEVSFEEIESNQEIIFNDVVYSIESQRYGPILGRSSAYYLYSKDENGNTYLMQFFTNDDNEFNHNAKMLKEVYLEEYSFTEEYFKISSY